MPFRNIAMPNITISLGAPKSHRTKVPTAILRRATIKGPFLSSRTATCMSVIFPRFTAINTFRKGITVENRKAVEQKSKNSLLVCE